MSTPDGAYMRASDAFSWYMEREPALRSTVVTAIWLDRPPDWDALVARVDRMTRFMPSLRQRVVESPFRLNTPRWTYDPDFDLNWHLSRVDAPAPHTRDVVLKLVRRSAMAAFDRDRPLWEVTVVEGIEDGSAALMLKLHHSLSDGVGGMQLLAIMCDEQREPADLGEMPPAPPGERLDLRALLSGAAASAAARGARLALLGATEAIPVLTRYARDPLGHLRGAAAMTRSVYRTAAPILDTRSPLMRERAMTRHVAMMEVPLDDLKRAAKTVDGTLNDAYLAAVTGGLRRYHERHEVTVESLRVVMPINIRAAGDTEWGNRITLQRLVVPVGEPDPATRMRLLHQVTQTARKEPSLPVTDAIAGALNMLPVGYVGGVLKHIDFLASNVPGTRVPVYLAGSKITGFFAFGPTIGASLNVTLVSYGSACDIGVNIDTAAVPDPEVMLECLHEGFAEVTALGIRGDRRTQARQGRRRGSKRAAAHPAA